MRHWFGRALLALGCSMCGATVTLTDGRKLFLGSSNPDADK
jgi:hypothetical protein